MVMLDTLRFHREHCVGMAATMIGERKAIIAIAEGNRFTALTRKSSAMPMITASRKLTEEI